VHHQAAVVSNFKNLDQFISVVRIFVKEFYEMFHRFSASDNYDSSEVSAEYHAESPQEVVDKQLCESNEDQRSGNDFEKQYAVDTFGKVSQISEVDYKEEKILLEYLPVDFQYFGVAVDFVKAYVERNDTQAPAMNRWYDRSFRLDGKK